MFKSDVFFLQFRQHLRKCGQNQLRPMATLALIASDLIMVYENCGSSMTGSSNLDFV